MAFDFSKRTKKRHVAVQAVPTDESEPKLTDHQRDYRDRQKAEVARYKLAVDGDFNWTVCFCDEAARVKFAGFCGAVDSEWCAYGDDLGHAVESLSRVRKRSFGANRQWPSLGYELPFGVEVLKNAKSNEDRFFALYDHLLEAFEALPRQDHYRNPFDSHFYVNVIFRSRDDKREFLRSSGLARFGDPFADGPRLIKALGI